MDMFELISTLTAAYGPSGREQAVAAVIAGLAKPYADEISTDVMGNLMVHKRGEGQRLMLAAHMDTVGLVVTHIEEDGALRAGKVGGIAPKEVRDALVRFENGVYGTVKVHGAAKEDKPAVDDLYIDIGAGSKEQAGAMVQLGDVAVFAGQTVQTGERIISPHLDNRASCAVLLKVLEQLKASAYDVTFAFTVQEELGLRGAKTAAYETAPDLAIAVDVTSAWDWPGAPKSGSAALGEGAAVKVMDASVICHPAMVEMLAKSATREGIKVQRDVLTKGGTDAGAIYQSRTGVVTGGISIPCRYAHTPTAMIDLRDVEACVATLIAFIESK